MSRRSLSSSLSILLLLLVGLVGCGGSSKPIKVSINTPASTAIDPGDAVTLTVTVDNDNADMGVTWTLAGTGCSGSACGALSGNTSTSVTYTAPATVTTAFSVTITATSVKTTTVSNSITLNIPANPAITTALGALTAGQVGSTYSATVALSGGISPYTWTVKSGNLPTGLTLGSSTGTISGIPTATGNYTFTLEVTDSGTPTALTASGTFSIDIAPAPAIVFSTTSLPSGTIGTAYTAAVAATGGAGALTYKVTSGGLPAGLSMSASGGISGTPTTAAKSSFTVTASDAYGDTGTANLSITISYPQLTITTASLPTGYVGSAYSSTTLAASGGSNSGYTWTWAAQAGSSLPGGLTLSTGGTIAGTPTTAGTYNIVFTVTDSAQNTANAPLALTVDPAVSVTTASLPTGYAGSAYTQTTLAATGGAGSPYTWTWAAASGSSLPAGMTFSTGGVLAGTPTTAGGYSVVITAKDSAGNTGNKTFSITIGGAVSITTTSLPGGYQGTSYTSTQLTATGGAGSPYTWTWVAASGSTLPPGLSLSGTGVITGTPTGAGTYNVVVTAKDSASNTAQATFSIVIEGTLVISTTTVPTGYVGSSYPQTTLAASGGTGSGTYTWTWAAAAGSSLPGGLNLSSAGVISGAPTTAGTYSVVVTAQDTAGHTANATITITVDAGVSVTTASLPTGYSGSAYTQTTLAATGGAGSPYTWTWAAASGSSLPAGLTFSTGGVLAGTPTTAASYSVVFTAKDSAGNTGSTTLGITIDAGITIASTPAPPAGYQGTSYPAYSFAAAGGAGGPYTWTWVAAAGSSLPAGLTLGTNGALTGTPTTGGTFSVLVTAKDSAGNQAQATFSITITAKLTITTASLPSGAVSEAYPSTQLVATGGTGTDTWSWAAAAGSSIPAGLGISGSGLITGTPTAQGSYSVVVTVQDTASHTATATFAIAINAQLAITTTSLPAGTTGVMYSQTLAATGGVGTLTWSVATTGTNNLSTFNLSFTNAGLLSGTPTVTGSVSFTAQVKDSTGATATQPLTFAIYNPLSQNATGLPLTGNTGVAYNGSVAGSGGSGNYCWTVTGLPSDGLSGPAPNAPCGFASSSYLVSGTPTSAANVIITLKLTDTTTGASVSDGYTIVVTNPTPLTLPAPNPASLPSATQNQSYSGSINATGGIGPYTWKINGATVSGSVTLSDGISASASGEILSMSGTPTATGSVSLTNVTITDSETTPVTAGPDTYTITVNPASQINGQIFLNNVFYCGTSPSVPPITVTLTQGSTTVQTTTTGSNGTYSFENVANGTYTITPTITGAESLFFPANYTSVVINNNSSTGDNFSADIGYTVSGSISYSGSKTGQTYIVLEPSGCTGMDGLPGTSITETTLTGGGAFTIRGVPPGTYLVYAWMDPLGQGQPNTADPSGTSGATVDVTDANVTGAMDTLTDPTLTTPTTAPNLKSIAPTNLGVVISFGGGSITNGSGVEEFTSYTVQWSTTTGGFGSANSETFAAIGKSANVWILNNAIQGITGSFANNTAYYFRVRGINPAGSGPWTYWGGAGNSCSSTSCATTVTVGAAGASSGWNEVSGTVTIPSSITVSSDAVLYAGFYDQDTNTAYATAITNPSNATPNQFTVYVPSGSDYIQFGILDQNDDGLIDVGDVDNVNNNGSYATVTISGPLTNQDITLPSFNSQATVTTQFFQSTSPSGTSSGYSLNFQVREGDELPVAVTLASGSWVLEPIDLSDACQGCGSLQFTYYNNIGVTPAVGDAYTFDVTYAENPPGSGTDTAAVTAVLGMAQAASSLAPNPSSTGVSSTPTFTWTYPPNPGNYVYQFSLQDSNGNTIWQIPSSNSNANGFTSAQIPMPGGLVFGVDPTDSTNTPNQNPLSSGTQYTWQVTTIDSNGNQASTQIYFTTQ